jgi:hypothetical protein
MRQVFTCRERICALFFKPQVVVEQALASVKVSRKNHRARSGCEREVLPYALDDGQLAHGKAD